MVRFGTLGIGVVLVGGVMLSWGALAGTGDGIVLDGTMNSAQSGALTAVDNDYAITPEMGLLSGNNLFHSFSDFNLESGESATFSGPDTLTNIISRVTGTNDSFIDGTIQSTVDGAGFYLLNPNGLIFGENASLSLTGAFHASTAAYLRVGDEGRFYASLGRESLFSAEAPQAFGFLSDMPSSILFQGGDLTVGEMTVVAGGITMHGGTLTTDAGDLSLISMSRAGEVQLGEDGWQIDAEDPGGAIFIDLQAEVTVQGSGGLVVQGEELIVSDATLARTIIGDLESPGGIEIALTGVLAVTAQGTIRTVNSGDGEGAGMTISAEKLTVSEGGRILSTNNGAGSGGELQLTLTDTLLISGSLDGNVSQIRSETNGTGGAGDVTLTAGTISLEAEGLIIGRTYGEGVGPDLSLQMSQLLMSDGGNIDNSTVDVGAGGNLTIEAEESVEISGSGAWNSGIYVNVYDAGDGGTLAITAPEVSLTDGGVINGSNNGNGAGSSLLLEVDTLDMVAGVIDFSSRSEGSGGAIAVSATESVNLAGANGESGYMAVFSLDSGHGGAISITAPEVNIVDGGYLSGDSYASGRSGTILLQVKNLVLREGLIDSLVQGTGHGGNIRIVASESVLVEGVAESDGPFGGISRIATATSGEGNSGSISIYSPELTIGDGGYLTVSSEQAFSGRAGSIYLEVGALALENGGLILADTASWAGAGSITIEAFQGITLTGVGDILDLASGISASAGGRGDGGDIALNTPLMTLSSGGIIQAVTFGSGNGGEIAAEVENLQMSDGGIIQVGTTDTGDGGGLTLTASGSLTLAGESSGIYAFSSGEGGGGALVLSAADEITLTDGAEIVSYATAAGDAGDILLEANSTTLSNARIATETVESGGGNITLNAQETLSLDGSGITTSVMAGEGGNITIDPIHVVLVDSTISTYGVGGEAGGAIDITTQQLTVDSDSLLSAVASLQVRGEVVQGAEETGVIGKVVAFLSGIIPEEMPLIGAACGEEGAGDGSLIVWGAEGECGATALFP
ncbi:MAG: filamentous hemagglutinin N-terminal domain-containing protein [Magnetococcales bacterium]|nr:filamentous hemagglutinin N-terminal domain-containing protein [Magnetococcales bacterium]